MKTPTSLVVVSQGDDLVSSLPVFFMHHLRSLRTFRCSFCVCPSTGCDPAATPGQGKGRAVDHPEHCGQVYTRKDLRVPCAHFAVFSACRRQTSAKAPDALRGKQRHLS